MPKLKTNRTAAKRFKITGTGKVVRRKASQSHFLTDKTRKRKRNLTKPTLVHKNNVKGIRRLLAK